MTVTDLAGRWRSTVVAGSRERLQLDVVGDVVVTDRPARPVTIAASIPKGDRLDWMVQKLTELGVDRLVLLHAEHSTTRWDDARTASNASGRSGCRSRRAGRVAGSGRCASRVRLPRSSVLSTCVIAEPGGRRIAPSDDVIAIGPEGGWSPTELEAGARRVSLGSNVLRVETAAVVAATLSSVHSTSNVVSST